MMMTTTMTINYFIPCDSVYTEYNTLLDYQPHCHYPMYMHKG